MQSRGTLAFAGLGSMGRGMALHLLKNGYQVIGYDVHGPTLERFAAAGGRTASNAREAARQATCLICMVANSSQATPMLFEGDHAAASAMPMGSTLIMCSTVDPAYIDRAKARLGELGRQDIHLLDCPVSGGPGRAADGTLSIFSSGPDEQLDSVSEILSCMSGKLYRIPGGLGGGSKAKLLHQVLAGVNIAMASEAMGLAASAGLDTQAIFQEISESKGSSWMFENRVPFMLDAEAPPYSAMTIITKDVGIITKTGRASGFPLLMVSCAEQLYLTAISQGQADENDCMLVRLYLPDRSSLAESTGRWREHTKKTGITSSDIVDLMIGVHAAALAEAMSFSVALGIDTNLMHDIVVHAAGASSIMTTIFQDLQQGQWSLASIPTSKTITANLAAAIDKAYDLRYPLFLATTALQEFQRSAMQG